MIFFFGKGGGVKNHEYVPSLPTDLPDLRRIIEAAVTSITPDMGKTRPSVGCVPRDNNCSVTLSFYV